ncbi:hypothetical protein STCU_12343 [Strigomonas culicis]|uniref:Uncharacterized protein n=1 Tax=Strigomonas culicis TaxID=28005 RepID=S9TAW7_9TRYP|nr:hypothetical protein STCU_12343 [Strigomonas culicis]|eukprot:EPY15107.1 hypothetical protein STCU_12343 [Strigomonas culicis]
MLGGLIAMTAAAEYTGKNGLKEMSQKDRMTLVAYVIREFLKTRSLKHSHETPVFPFVNNPRNFNAVEKGMVDVHTGAMTQYETNEKTKKSKYKYTKEAKVFTFSRVQMLLACCFYGTAAIPISSSDTFEVLSASMFALYLNAFATDRDRTWSLADFLKSLDPTWTVENPRTKKLLSSIYGDPKEVNFQHLYFFKR